MGMVSEFGTVRDSASASAPLTGHLESQSVQALALQMAREMEPKTVLATAPASASQTAQTKASETETVMAWLMALA